MAYSYKRKSTTLSDFRYVGIGMNVRFDFDEVRRYFTAIAILYVLLKKTPEHYLSIETYSRSIARLTGAPRPYAIINLEQMRTEALKDDFEQPITNSYMCPKCKLKVGSINKYGLITIEDFRNMKRIRFNGPEGEAQMKRRFDWVLSLDEIHLKKYEFYGRAKTKNLFRIVQEWHKEHEEKQDWDAHVETLLTTGGRIVYV